MEVDFIGLFSVLESIFKGLAFWLSCAGERKQSFQFTVHTESTWNKRPNWVLAGQSEREMKEWIAAFKVRLRLLNSLDSSGRTRGDQVIQLPDICRGQGSRS